MNLQHGDKLCDSLIPFFDSFLFFVVDNGRLDTPQLYEGPNEKKSGSGIIMRVVKDSTCRNGYDEKPYIKVYVF